MLDRALVVQSFGYRPSQWFNDGVRQQTWFQQSDSQGSLRRTLFPFQGSFWCGNHVSLHGFRMSHLRRDGASCRKGAKQRNGQGAEGRDQCCIPVILRLNWSRTDMCWKTHANVAVSPKWTAQGCCNKTNNDICVTWVFTLQSSQDTNGRWALNNLDLTSVPQLVLYEFFLTAGERLPWQCTTEWGRKCRVTGRHDSRFGKPLFPRTLQELCSIIFCIVLPSSHPNQELRPVFCNVAFFAVSLCYSQLRTTGWNSDRWVSRRKVCSLRSSASFLFLKSKSVHLRLFWLAVVARPRCSDSVLGSRRADCHEGGWQKCMSMTYIFRWPTTPAYFSG